MDWEGKGLQRGDEEKESEEEAEMRARWSRAEGGGESGRTGEREAAVEEREEEELRPQGSAVRGPPAQATPTAYIPSSSSALRSNTQAFVPQRLPLQPSQF